MPGAPDAARTAGNEQRAQDIRRVDATFHELSTHLFSSWWTPRWTGSRWKVTHRSSPC